MTAPTRRTFLRTAALGIGGAVLARATAGCGDNAPASSGAGAVFEPTADSVIVSISDAPPLTALDVTAMTADGTAVAFATLATDERGTGAVAVDGLAADTAYAIAIADTTLRTRTAPAPTATRAVRLAISGDVDPQQPQFASPIWTALAAAAPEVYLSIGDFPYCDNGPDVAHTVDAYRAVHATLRASPPIRDFLAATPCIAIYDDHEFRNDWDAHFVAAEPARYAAATQVWDEFFPLRRTAATDAGVRYRAIRWGAHAEIFVLDCRRWRSANADADGPAKTMLGAAQRAWATAAIAASTATFKLVLSSVPLDFGNGDDHWRAYTHERDAMFAALAGVPGVLWLSADQHWFAAHRHAGGVREIQMGPIARGIGVPPEPAPAGVLYRNSAVFNFALLDITADSLTVTGIAADGSQFYTETLSPSDLTAS